MEEYDFPCTVCVAAYNGERFIKEQLESLLSDIKEVDEVIVVNDGSTDSTLDILHAVQDPRLSVETTCNRGVVRAFETALKRASKRIIFLCDQDDLWYKGKRDVMVSELLKSGASAAVCDCNVIDESGVEVFDSYFRLRGSRPGLFWNMYKNSYLGCGMCVRRELLDVAMPFPKSISMHDEWLGLIAELKDGVVFVDRVLFGYRRHSGNVTALSQKRYLFALKKRVTNAICLLIRIFSVNLKGSIGRATSKR